MKKDKVIHLYSMKSCYSISKGSSAWNVGVVPKIEKTLKQSYDTQYT